MRRERAEISSAIQTAAFPQLDYLAQKVWIETNYRTKMFCGGILVCIQTDFQLQTYFKIQTSS